MPSALPLLALLLPAGGRALLQMAQVGDLAAELELLAEPGLPEAISDLCRNYAIQESAAAEFSFQSPDGFNEHPNPMVLLTCADNKKSFLGLFDMILCPVCILSYPFVRLAKAPSEDTGTAALLQWAGRPEFQAKILYAVAKLYRSLLPSLGDIKRGLLKIPISAPITLALEWPSVADGVYEPDVLLAVGVGVDFLSHMVPSLVRSESTGLVDPNNPRPTTALLLEWSLSSPTQDTIDPHPNVILSFTSMLPIKKLNFNLNFEWPRLWANQSETPTYKNDWPEILWSVSITREVFTTSDDTCTGLECDQCHLNQACENPQNLLPDDDLFEEDFDVCQKINMCIAMGGEWCDAQQAAECPNIMRKKTSVTQESSARKARQWVDSKRKNMQDTTKSWTSNVRSAIDRVRDRFVSNRGD